MRNRSFILYGLVLVLAGSHAAAASCTASTPEQAAQIAAKTDGAAVIASATSAADRYQMIRVTEDPVLHNRWGWVENCSHPERPLAIIPLPANMRVHPQASALPLRKTDLIAPAVPRIAVSPLSVQKNMVAPDHTEKKPAVAAISSETTLVHPGDRVHLWSADRDVHLEIEVVALEYGRAGQAIHFRRNGQETLLTGVVVGKDAAELMP